MGEVGGNAPLWTDKIVSWKKLIPLGNITIAKHIGTTTEAAKSKKQNGTETGASLIVEHTFMRTTKWGIGFEGLSSFGPLLIPLLSPRRAGPSSERSSTIDRAL